jgi:hypothetical protein
MKNIKTITEYFSQSPNLIDDIKKYLVTEDFLDGEEEFESLYGSDLESAWIDFSDSQELGDCQNIVSSISKKFPQVKRVFGEIEVDEPYVDGWGDSQNLETHHWATLNGKIYDFSKGTLRDAIQWEDVYDVEVEGEEWRYNIGVSESFQSNQTFTPQYILNYINDLHQSGWEGKRFEDPEWINSHVHFTLEKVNLNDRNIKWNFGQHPPIVKKYSKLGADIPPIVIDSNGYLIDGTHRAGSAKMLGLNSIMAYIGHN